MGDYKDTSVQNENSINKAKSGSALLNAINPTDVVSTSTSFGGGSKDDATEYMTIAVSSGVITFTFNIAGRYLINISTHHNHATTTTFNRITVQLAGSATRAVSISTIVNSNKDNTDDTTSRSFMVTATAGQNLTITPTYQCASPINASEAQHAAHCWAVATFVGDDE